MNDDDEEEPTWEGLAVKPSIGPRFGAAGAWNEAVANTYYARQADEDEVSKRVAEAGREARETVLWREQCAKETAAIANRILDRHGTYPSKPTPPTPAEVDAKRERNRAEMLRKAKQAEEDKMIRAKIIPPNRFPPGSFNDAFKRRGEVLNHGGVYADTALWRKHEEKWEHFSEYARGQSIIRPWDVPWPESGVGLYRHLLLQMRAQYPNVPEDQAEKHTFKRCAMRWHPDKLMAAIGMRLLPEEYDEVGAEIAGVFRGIQEEHKNRLRIRGTLPPGMK